MRRALLVADIVGIVVAYCLASALYAVGRGDAIGHSVENLIFAVTLPIWPLLFKLHGLYDRDVEQADTSTVDDLFGVVQAVTLGVWSFEVFSLVSGLASPAIPRLAVFWVLAIAFVSFGRFSARGVCRRLPSYLQRVVVVGEGDVGQLVARKIDKHPEYGLSLVGFVDGDPKRRRQDVSGVATLGGLEQLESIVRTLDIDRVIVAFSREPDAGTMAILRALRDAEITVDVVPRLFELVGPRASVHALEGLALLCVPPARLSPSSLWLKRMLDVVVASVLLVLFAPFCAYAAFRIKRESPGPIFFRQERLGMHKKTFTAFKFRTMQTGTDPEEHRAYIRSIRDASATAGSNAVYKLDRDDVVTLFGRSLRNTSLDEVPQLINVLKGDMSMVGPRPCIPYETENFEPYQEDRFLVPQGLTGLWQVTARANATFGEALDMDVAYVHGWSLGLDLRLMFRTPLAVVRQRKATA